MKASNQSHPENVYDLFSGLPLSQKPSQTIIRLAPELDGLEMLYSNHSNPGKLFALKVLCWALYEDGRVSGMIPWLDKMISCEEIDDPLRGQWEGYYDPLNDDVFFEAPIHKIIELETAANYYHCKTENDRQLIQIIPDNIGTHAVFSLNGNQQLYLTEVVSWHLRGDGHIHPMVIDRKSTFDAPVLPDAECLVSADNDPDFRYFFQHHIANRIKAQDPEALAVIAVLLGDIEETEGPH
ncbi:MAG: hypothetical protein KDI30_07675 [Pseudomonadales bacterium]|nr:hypothetical protein [Pseudomonadales bacterium]